MIEWREEGVLLSVRPHGETSVIVEAFTRAHGRHLGVVRGGVSRKLAPVLQPGAQLDLRWKARLEDHMGAFTVEPVRGRAAAVLGDRLALSAMSSALALARFSLAERAAYPGFYDQTVALLDALAEGTGWLPAYLDWEMALLDQMGFGLDLSGCAVRGVNEDLAFVSPRTGRAVSRQAAGAWVDRLLPLPEVMLGGPAHLHGVLEGLTTTGHFLEHKLAPALGNRPPPEARARFIDVLSRAR
ncbi:DNA repair protein RecO [Dinoroseobacter shibae DFL 12 = DSM 16493]|uniref:DNA repair protein RecO n=1 Tax=Dinoroseobacter shibae (strain DSM 16493 / NCIMB 14021 / DFL 12) TaxID=398580 RepID=RECO_DINSH|nr:DNA repair protein RecO [Dinoroseobacter shibae]A8LLE2.1 RecName: Full=DNA repair protein RecO; AltName: Full=Recombination protein O [Dinoroseobacter shibae DFL 12 = DSM 16493]ABV91952.1 DNA repair protein RecO [Dinoroseobacter shibae DFL 12 = DSM 16493]URF46925.1 DNA repair protein RecO [Dinoroseobacter shibae]URF51236.1 DNA repair protein RecO [Dinoroseobacter shibae]